MKNFFIIISLIIIVLGANFSAASACDVQHKTTVIYNQTNVIAKAAKLAKPAKLATPSKPHLMYPNPQNGYRTGFSRPKTRFAHINKRFSKPQTRFAHKRPEYIYSREYQNNITNRHNPGMKKNNKTKLPAAVLSQKSKNNITNKNKIIACSGITYYGIQNYCK